MSTFFLADDGYHYPVSRIARFSMSNDDQSRPILTVDLDEEMSPVTASRRNADIILRASCQAVPAEAGTFYVGLMDDIGGNEIWMQPVIAWLIQPEREPLPVTIHGVEAGVVNRYCIRTPNGAIADYGVGDYDNLTAWLQTVEFNTTQIQAALLVEQEAIKRR